MKIQDTLKELEGVAAKKGIRVAYEAMGADVGAGGLCKVKGEYRIIIEKRASPGERLTVLAQALGHFSLDDIFVAPEVREVIEKAAVFRRTSAVTGAATSGSAATAATTTATGLGAATTSPAEPPAAATEPSTTRAPRTTKTRS